MSIIRVNSLLSKWLISSCILLLVDELDCNLLSLSSFFKIQLDDIFSELAILIKVIRLGAFTTFYIFEIYAFDKPVDLEISSRVKFNFFFDLWSFSLLMFYLQYSFL